MTDVVLVHAFPLDSRLFEHVRPVFGGRLHTPDLPGFGRSIAQAPAHSLDAMAEAVHAYVEAQGLSRFVLGGVSMGGYVTLAYVRRYGTNSLAGLVLAHTRADADSPETKANRDASLALISGGSTTELVNRQLPKMFAPPVASWVEAEARAVMEEQPVGAVAAAIEALRDRPDSSNLLEKLDVPVLVLAGEGDPVSPPAVMRAMAAAIPRARYEELPACGHLGPLQSPAEWGARVASFAGTPVSRPVRNP